ncbi:MAG: DUF3047 domain-containing protein [Candidatus Didemnitutus sp.]|nr:DUF3047 domain-containing protein [Candidatus Didemnitutus sp.]
MNTRWILLIPYLLGIVPSAWSADEAAPLFRDDFADRTAWADWIFPKIPQTTDYAVETRDGSSVLCVVSAGAASGLLSQQAFTVPEGRDYRVRWRWRADRLPTAPDPRTKPGDDYALRVYVIYERPEKEAGWLERYALRKAPFRELGYLPVRSLAYVWTETPGLPAYFENPYTDRVIMLPRTYARAERGEWREVEIDPAADYRRITGEAAPRRFRLAIMGDADNSASRSEAWLDWIEVGDAAR